MTDWVAGDLVLDEYQIRVPGDAPSGAYTLEMGLYDLAAPAERAEALQPAGADHVILGTVEVR